MKTYTLPNTKLFPYLVFLLVVFMACSSEKPLSDEEREQIKSEVSERVKEYRLLYKNKDLEWVRDFYMDTEEFTIVTDNKVRRATSVDVVEQVYADLFSNMKELLYSNSSNENTYVIGKNAASHIIDFDVKRITNNNDTIQVKGTMLFVLEKKNGKWQVPHASVVHDR